MALADQDMSGIVDSDIMGGLPDITEESHKTSSNQNVSNKEESKETPIHIIEPPQLEEHKTSRIDQIRDKCPTHQIM